MYIYFELILFIPIDHTDDSFKCKKRYPDLETTNGECALFFRIYKMVHTVISLSVPAGEISTEQGCGRF